MNCRFDDPKQEQVFYQDELIHCLWDAYPVSDGHALVIRRRHVATWFDATPEEQAAIARGIEIARQETEKTRKPDGYNVGFNAGLAVGQTIFHLHVYVIPRDQGDVENPRGGVRYVVPDTAMYETASDRCRLTQSDAGPDRGRCSVVTMYASNLPVRVSDRDLKRAAARSADKETR